MALKTRDLAKMSGAEREQVIADAFASSATTSRSMMVTIGARIRHFESRYNLPTSQLPAALAENRIQETADICEWQFWVSVRDRLASPRPEWVRQVRQDP